MNLKVKMPVGVAATAVKPKSRKRAARVYLMTQLLEWAVTRIIVCDGEVVAEQFPDQLRQTLGECGVSLTIGVEQLRCTIIDQARFENWATNTLSAADTWCLDEAEFCLSSGTPLRLRVLAQTVEGVSAQVAGRQSRASSCAVEHTFARSLTYSTTLELRLRREYRGWKRVDDDKSAVLTFPQALIVGGFVDGLLLQLCVQTRAKQLVIMTFDHTGVLVKQLLLKREGQRYLAFAADSTRVSLDQVAPLEQNDTSGRPYRCREGGEISSADPFILMAHLLTAPA